MISISHIFVDIILYIFLTPIQSNYISMLIISFFSLHLLRFILKYYVNHGLLTTFAIFIVSFVILVVAVVVILVRCRLSVGWVSCLFRPVRILVCLVGSSGGLFFGLNLCYLVIFGGFIMSGNWSFLRFAYLYPGEFSLINYFFWKEFP